MRRPLPTVASSSACTGVELALGMLGTLRETVEGGGFALLVGAASGRLNCSSGPWLAGVLGVLEKKDMMLGCILPAGVLALPAGFFLAAMPGTPVVSMVG